MSETNNAPSPSPANKLPDELQISTGSEICFKDAVELAAMIRKRELSATEVMAAFLSQIKRVNPKVNARD
ncbi:MAG: hypothetical protein AABN34_03895 [Acidobacteriota bacterium]